MNFSIDSGFDDLSFRMGRFDLSHVLLMNNAEIPWFILIPETQEVELCDLSRQTQQTLVEESNLLSRFVRQYFTIDKLNVACNGNVIRQMHWHVIGRRFNDYCWPDVVWGKNAPAQYEDQEVVRIASWLESDPVLLSKGYRRV